MSESSRLLTPRNLRCWSCKAEYPLGLVYRCSKCGFPVDVVYDFSQVGGTGAKYVDEQFDGMWRYFPVLPLRNPDSIITLGEGGTPLVKCRGLGEVYGVEQLWVKAEYVNPTGSFKDRPISVAVSVAKELGVDGVVTSSSGNAGAALAAYAARAQLCSYVFVPDVTPATKLAQIVAAGATLVRVRGTVSEAFSLAKEVAERLKWMNVTSTFICPYTLEGDKTIAYELHEALGGQAPKWILVPVGAGPLLVGIYKGYRELHRMRRVEHVPRMIAVQAAGCAPIVEAYQSGAESVKPWGEPQTVAGGIGDPLLGYSEDGTLTLRVIRESEGLAVRVSDEAILTAMRLAAQKEGVFLEPSGAASIAGLTQLVASKMFGSEDLTVVMATGGGLKAPEVWATEVELPEAIQSSYQAFLNLYGACKYGI